MYNRFWGKDIAKVNADKIDKLILNFVEEIWFNFYIVSGYIEENKKWKADVDFRIRCWKEEDAFTDNYGINEEDIDFNYLEKYLVEKITRFNRFKK